MLQFFPFSFQRYLKIYLMNKGQFEGGKFLLSIQFASLKCHKNIAIWGLKNGTYPLMGVAEETREGQYLGRRASWVQRQILK